MFIFSNNVIASEKHGWNIQKEKKNGKHRDEKNNRVLSIRQHGF